MTAVEVYDTNTGTALTVREVAAALDRPHNPVDYARLYANDLQAINERAAEDVAHALLSGAHALRAVANDLHAGRWTYQMDPPPVPVFAELPPNPALQLAPEALDAEHAQAMAIQAERRRRMTALAPVGQRFVPEIPSATFLLSHKTSDDVAEEIKQRWLERYGRRVEVIRRPPWSRRVRTWASGWAEWLKPSGGESDDR